MSQTAGQESTWIERLGMLRGLARRHPAAVLVLAGVVAGGMFGGGFAAWLDRPESMMQTELRDPAESLTHRGTVGFGNAAHAFSPVEILPPPERQSPAQRALSGQDPNVPSPPPPRYKMVGPRGPTDSASPGRTLRGRGLNDGVDIAPVPPHATSPAPALDPAVPDPAFGAARPAADDPYAPQPAFVMPGTPAAAVSVADETDSPSSAPADPQSADEAWIEMFLPPEPTGEAREIAESDMETGTGSAIADTDGAMPASASGTVSASETVQDDTGMGEPERADAEVPHLPPLESAAQDPVSKPVDGFATALSNADDRQTDGQVFERNETDLAALPSATASRPGNGYVPIPGVKPQAPAPGQALWEANAVAHTAFQGTPRVVLVIDDMGVDRKRTALVSALPGPLTTAFLSYAGDLQQQSEIARYGGHELLLHLPMQPKDATLDPGPGVLTTDMDAARIRETLLSALARFEGYIGVNNHMGSAFTEDARGMAEVMRVLNEKGLIYLDSLTTPKSVAADTAQEARVPFAARHLFIDNDPDFMAVNRQLEKLEAMAKELGFAIGIGHPKTGTIDALARWLPGLNSRGVELAPLSSVIRDHAALKSYRGTLAAADVGTSPVKDAN